MKEKQNVLEWAEEQARKYKAFGNFLDAIDADASRKLYSHYLRDFMKFHGQRDFAKLAKSKTERIDDLIEQYLKHMKDRGLKSISIRKALAGVELFFTMNKCLWHKDLIHRKIKRDRHIPAGRGRIETEEIKKMLEYTKSPRTKALVHFFASTGCRPGALVDSTGSDGNQEPLKIKHLSKMKNCYSIRIYERDIEEYWAFLTPEATEALDTYFEWRKKDKTLKDKHGKPFKRKGETLTDESVVFAANPNERTERTHMTTDTVRQSLESLVRLAGIKREKVGKHNDKGITKQFRKRFNTICKLGKTNDNIAEKLMGHKRGLDGTYLQPTKEECFEEFEKAIPDLTIDPTERQKYQIKSQRDEIVKLEAKEREIDSLKERLEILEAENQIRKRFQKLN